MPSRIQRTLVRSSSADHFLAPLAVNGSSNENLDWQSSATRARGQVREITIRSVQQLAWELQFYGDATFDSTLLSNKFQGKHSFAAADGVQNDGAGPFYYHKILEDGISLDQLDISAPQPAGGSKKGKVHLKLVNRGPVAKLAAGAGAIEIEVIIEVP